MTSFRQRPAFDIVRLIDLRTPGESDYAFVIGGLDVPVLQADIEAELDAQSGTNLQLIDVSTLSPQAMLEQLRVSRSTVVMLTGFDGWTNEDFQALDINRSRLDAGSFLVFVMDFDTAVRFLDSAPNIKSWIGSRIFTASEDPGTMTAEEIETRLSQFREKYGLSDAEVIRKAESGELPPSPHFAEWLIMLGRGDLVG